MNSTPLLQVSAHLTPSSGTASKATAAESAEGSAGAPNFAGVMRGVDAKPARKSGLKAADADSPGSPLPATGNPAPAQPPVTAQAAASLANALVAAPPAAGAATDDDGDVGASDGLPAGASATLSQAAAALAGAAGGATEIGAGPEGAAMSAATDTASATAASDRAAGVSPPRISAMP